MLNYPKIFHFNNELTNQAGAYMIMTSAEKADYIIEELKEMLKNGIDINEVDIDYTDVNDVDMKRIKREVEEWWENVY